MKRVLMLHTGGTLGMTGTPLEPGALAGRLLEMVPELDRIAEIESRTIANLDSSDIHPGHWARLAREISEARDDFDGFVIIHGTDTMAYTASALAFALHDLDRPVVLTGAQRPLAALRTDARRNLTDALDIATRSIPEVGICFDGMLFRGCKTTKTSASDYRGFDSPGCRPLAKLGVDVEISDHVRAARGGFKCLPGFRENVGLVNLFPGMNPEALEHICATPGLEAIVLVAFGLGTVPTKERPVAEVLEAAIDGGVDVVVISPSLGHVDFERYQNSLPLRDAGAISGRGMTVEAAVTKTMHALANYPKNRSERRVYIESDRAGEMQ